MKLHALKWFLAGLLLVCISLCALSCGEKEGPHAHVWNLKQVVSPTCATDGYSIYGCSCGQTMEDYVVPATDHTYEEKVIGATCTEHGMRVSVCTTCGVMAEVTEENVIEAVGHTHAQGDKGKVVPSTCVTHGYTAYTCTACGVEYQTDIQPYTECEYTVSGGTPSDSLLAIGGYSYQTYICKFCGDQKWKVVLVDLHWRDAKDPGASYMINKPMETNMEALKADLSGNATYRKIAYAIDSQKYLDADGSVNGFRADIDKGGYLVSTGSQLFIEDVLDCFTKDSAYASMTISFDLTLNYNVTKDTSKDATYLFSTHTESRWQNMPFVLALGHTNHGTASAPAYELIVRSMKGGVNTLDVSTGHKIELGKRYSYRLDVVRTELNEIFVTVSYQKLGAKSFTTVGTYQIDPSTTEINYFRPFVANYAKGNVFGNFKIETYIEE